MGLYVQPLAPPISMVLLAPIMCRAIRPAHSRPPPFTPIVVQLYALDTSTGAVKGQLQMYPGAAGQTVHPQAASVT